MFEPDSAQLVVSLVLAVLALILLSAFLDTWEYYRRGMTLVLLIVFIIAGTLAIGEYQQTEKHWNTLTQALDSAKIEEVFVVYPYKKAEPAKTTSIEAVINNHAEVPGPVHESESFINERYLNIGLANGPSAAVRKELAVAFEEVYGLRTVVEYHDPKYPRHP